MLNLVKIELRGFKSFADKVEIPFKEGVTAIIGPNGCGKSNVADAIRWTLGEKSAKSLRGKSMQDVIFAGTERRKSMSYCEVSLYFNNENSHIFPNMPYDEVIITRKLDRSGQSEYYINRNRIRLTDIRNLLHDTGIGKDGYTLIGQGKVAEIMSAKPEDRRLIFEEAAEIAGMRDDLNKANRDLERTAMNLQTANELIAEIEKQINPLRKQAETAEKYFALKEKLKLLEVNLYIYNYENNRSIKQKISDRLKESDAALKKKDDEYRVCCLKYDESILASSEIDRKYDDNNAELLSLKVDAARIEGEQGVIKEKISHIQGEITRLSDDLQSVDAQLVVSSQQIDNAQRNKEQKLAEYIEISKQYEELKKSYDVFIRTLEGNETDIETRNTEYVRLIEQLGEMKTNLTGLMSEKAINEERLKNIRELLVEKKKTLDAELTNLATYDGSVKAAKEKTRQTVSAYNETLQRKQDASKALIALNEDIINLNNKLSATQSKLQMANSVKNNYEGYYDSVKKLMTLYKTNPFVSSRVLGVFAQIIDVPEEFQSAIEYAVGGAMQNVVVETKTDARDLIDFMKGNGIGRITFRPLNACRPRVMPFECRGILTEPGCYGMASDLVKFESKYLPIVDTLLGNTVVVNNITNALALYNKYSQKVKIVTLDGDVFTRNGEITGGAKQAGMDLFNTNRDIKKFTQLIEDYKRNIALLKQQYADTQMEIAECDSLITKYSEQLSNLRIEIGLNEDKAKQSGEIVQRLQREISSDAEETEKIKAAIDNIDQQLNGIDALEKTVAEKKEEMTFILENSKTSNTKQRSERDELSERVTRMRVDLAERKSELDTWDGEIFRLGRERSQLEEDKLDIIAALKTQKQNLNNISSAPKKAVLSDKDAARITQLEEEIAALSERKRTISDEIKALDAKKTSLYDERTTISEKIIRDENMLENVDIEIRNMQQHILEEYDLTYDSALQFKDEEFKAHGAIGDIADVKRSINLLGNVNPLALQTLQETQERLEHQVLNRDDVQKAYDDIVLTRNILIEKMQEKFSAAFDAINENFKVVFSQLFGGGKGELRLNFNDTDNVLEAGIDIFAQPPGKRLQNISLLSGGEQALTAISILFAILKLKPMPFCVLDEIEAALDDANVNLFAEFLKKFSDYTQFIVITHRKPTMRHADTIFGVTMEEKGVTKIVSIEFEEAVKHAN